jgi:hypothetical protein
MLIDRVYDLMLVIVMPLVGKAIAEIPRDLEENMNRLSGYDI